MAMNREDFQTLAEMRVEDARVLLDAGRYAGAYYLCGYAVECALKACIAKQTQMHEFPELDRVRQSYTHRLPQLVRLARLEGDLNRQRQRSSIFDDYWNRLEDWNEQSRYEHDITEQRARALVDSVTDPLNGVVTWLRNHW